MVIEKKDIAPLSEEELKAFKLFISACRAKQLHPEDLGWCTGVLDGVCKTLSLMGITCRYTIKKYGYIDTFKFISKSGYAVEKKVDDKIEWK